jgi:hypothetical protein
LSGICPLCYFWVVQDGEVDNFKVQSATLLNGIQTVRFEFSQNIRAVQKSSSVQKNPTLAQKFCDFLLERNEWWNKR